MKILLDHCVDRRLRRSLTLHTVSAAQELGWAAYKNGALLTAAEGAGFEVVLTVDRNLEHQQNMTGRSIAVLVMAAASSRLDDLTLLLPHVEAAMRTVQPGEIVTVRLPPPASEGGDDGE